MISVAKMHEISLMSISNINNFPHTRGGYQGEDWGGDGRGARLEIAEGWDVQDGKEKERSNRK
jgi:hypothetical protein